MNDNIRSKSKPKSEEAPLSFWKSVVLIIVFVFAIVTFFGLLIFIFIGGAQQLGMSAPVYIAIFVGVSGIFAWLIKRLSDTVSGMSRYWFPEDETPD